MSWQAKLLATVHGLAPELTAEAMALVNRLLLNAEGGSSRKKTGRESESAFTRSSLTALGQRAARRYNQLHKIAQTEPWLLLPFVCLLLREIDAA